MYTVLSMAVAICMGDVSAIIIILCCFMCVRSMDEGKVVVMVGLIVLGITVHCYSCIVYVYYTIVNYVL